MKHEKQQGVFLPGSGYILMRMPRYNAATLFLIRMFDFLLCFLLERSFSEEIRRLEKGEKK